jgi:hypothetical protein
MLNMSTFADTADIYAIVHFVPHPCHHITVDQSHSSGETVAKWRHRPPKEKSHGVKSGDRGGHRINASYSCPVTFIERHICYYCLLAANHGNSMRGALKIKTRRDSFSIGVRITTIRCIVYLLWIFKMFYGLMKYNCILDYGTVAPRTQSCILIHF